MGAVNGSHPARRQLINLIIVCAVAAAGGFLFGFDQIIISGTVEAVREQFGLSAAMEGFFVSAALIGAMLGAGAAGWLADWFGRRVNLLLAGALTLVSALVSSAAADPTLLSLARLAGGMGIGVASMICPLYIAELAPVHLRGRLVTLFQFAITLGILLALMVNASLAANVDQVRRVIHAAWVSAGQVELWRLMLATQILPSALFLLACLGLPESPRWLALRQRRDEALAVYVRFMSSAQAEAALSEVKAAPARTLNMLFGGYRRALVIALVLAFMSEASGITVVFYYGPTILTQAGFTFGGALSGIVSIGVVNMLATLIALWLIDRVGRRPLLLAGTCGAVLTLAWIASALGGGPTPLLVALICTFVIFFAFGIGPIKFVVASELFPTSVRGSAVAIVTVAVWATGALVNQLFPIVREAWGPGASFLIFAGILALQLPFALLVMPETAGRSIEALEVSARHGVA
jgi:MFS transporter, SP family, arabinose:H+ symporter